mmetsp:Transcript_44222/g.70840  ORF Transcript_44222/g.70840 Transcript_44222/m.70840 type:complete len:92 (+) Transcript_44222:1212-1487(+)
MDAVDEDVWMKDVTKRQGNEEEHKHTNGAFVDCQRSGLEDGVKLTEEREQQQVVEEQIQLSGHDHANSIDIGCVLGTMQKMSNRQDLQYSQ